LCRLAAGGRWIRNIGPAAKETAVRGAPYPRAAVPARSGSTSFSAAAFATDPSGGAIFAMLGDRYQRALGFLRSRRLIRIRPSSGKSSRYRYSTPQSPIICIRSRDFARTGSIIARSPGSLTPLWHNEASAQAMPHVPSANCPRQERRGARH
jgi:hypothetical protein